MVDHGWMCSKCMYEDVCEDYDLWEHDNWYQCINYCPEPDPDLVAIMAAIERAQNGGGHYDTPPVVIIDQ